MVDLDDADADVDSLLDRSSLDDRNDFVEVDGRALDGRRAAAVLVLLRFSLRFNLGVGTTRRALVALAGRLLRVAKERVDVVTMFEENLKGRCGVLVVDCIESKKFVLLVVALVRWSREDESVLFPTINFFPPPLNFSCVSQCRCGILDKPHHRPLNTTAVLDAFIPVTCNCSQAFSVIVPGSRISSA